MAATGESQRQFAPDAPARERLLAGILAARTTKTMTVGIVISASDTLRFG